MTFQAITTKAKRVIIPTYLRTVIFRKRWELTLPSHKLSISFLMISTLINFALVVLSLLMVWFSGIIGTSKIEFFSFSGTETIKRFKLQQFCYIHFICKIRFIWVTWTIRHDQELKKTRVRYISHFSIFSSYIFTLLSKFEILS